MKRKAALYLLAAGCLVALVACGKKDKGGGADAAKAKDKTYADSVDGLKEQIGDVMTAAQKGQGSVAKAYCSQWRLPDYEAWFKKVFGDSRGGKLATAYKLQRTVIPTYGEVVEKQRKAGNTGLQVTKLTDPKDLNARGLQSKALNAMKSKVTLYDVRLVKPGKKLGYSIWSFVYVGKKFRLIGKLRKLNDKPSSKYGKAFDELPRGMVLKLLRKKGK